MHDAVRVSVVQSLQKLVNVEADVHVRESWVQNFEVLVVDVLEDERRGLGLRVTDLTGNSSFENIQNRR